MSAGDGHDHHFHGAAALRAGARHQLSLAVAFALTACFLVVEVVAGLWTGSLALLSDAGHLLTDVLGLGMAWAAIHAADREAHRSQRHGSPGSRTFGLYRLEILAAFVNSLLLFAVAAWVLLEAANRLTREAVEVKAGPMLAVAVGGLVVNLIAFALLRRGARESLNVEGAYLEVVADALGSVGVIVAGVLLLAFGWTWADPLVAAAIGLWILPRTVRLGSKAARVLLQAAPPHIQPELVQADLLEIEGVIGIHDLHVWTLTSEMENVSAHLTIAEDADSAAVLAGAQRVLRDRYGVAHATLQVAPATGECCAELQW